MGGECLEFLGAKPDRMKTLVSGWRECRRRSRIRPARSTRGKPGRHVARTPQVPSERHSIVCQMEAVSSGPQKKYQRLGEQSQRALGSMPVRARVCVCVCVCVCHHVCLEALRLGRMADCMRADCTSGAKPNFLPGSALIDVEKPGCSGSDRTLLIRGWQYQEHSGGLGGSQYRAQCHGSPILRPDLS